MSKVTTGEVTSRDGTRIVFERSGEGPPVILVGGALSTRGASRDVAALLSSDLVAYAYDRRGRGDSGDTAPYAVEREVEDLQALIEEAGGSAFVFGHSSGAGLTLETASRIEGIDRAALYEPPYILNGSRPSIPEGYLDDLVELLAQGRRGDAIERFLTVGVGLPEEAVTSMRAAPSWRSLEELAHTLPYDNEIMSGNLVNAPLPVERWRSVTVPVLVLDGDASPEWIRTSAQAVADALPAGTRRSLPGQTHQVDPSVLVPALAEFFLG